MTETKSSFRGNLTLLGHQRRPVWKSGDTRRDLRDDEQPERDELSGGSSESAWGREKA